MTTRNRNAKALNTLQAISRKALTLGNLLSAIQQGEDLSQAEFSLKIVNRDGIDFQVNVKTA